LPEEAGLLELSKSVALRAGRCLLDSALDLRSYAHSNAHPREIKALADTVLEREILDGLGATGLPILSEEAGWVGEARDARLTFIVDPLDGTFNFVKGLGPCAVSIALWERESPVFGVIYSLRDRQLYWGGARHGAFRDGERIAVSTTGSLASASLCTGFPARLDLNSERVRDKFWRTVGAFSKVRMMGSAAMSLVNVATGAADAYCEQQIMLWDVAAGLAIVEGAGGATRFVSATKEDAMDVSATNGNLSWVN